MKKSILILALILSSWVMNAQHVYIPDEVFREYLNAELPTYMDATGDSLNTDLAAAYAGAIDFGIDNVYVTNLLGISYFTNLTSLTIKSNDISDLDLSNNTALTYLNFKGGDLISLDLTNNVALTSVTCWYTEITTLDLSNNTALDYLEIVYNELLNINLDNNIALSYLHINTGYNHLTNLDLSNNIALTTLVLSPSYLQTLDLSNNEALTDLSLSGGLLSSLDLSNNLSLTNFQYNNCNLTSLDLSNNIALTSLTLSSDDLTSLDLSTNVALNSLSFTYSHLTSLDLSNNSALTHLNFGGNELSTLDLSNTLALTHLYVNSNSLALLDLSNTLALTYFEFYGSALTSLDLSNHDALTNIVYNGNGLTTLDLSNNTALTQLDFYGSSLTTLDLSNDVALTHLTCFNTDLTSIDLSSNVALSHFYLYGGGLSSLDLSNNVALSYFYCYNNQLAILDLSNNLALNYLDCSSNQLTSLDISENAALTFLNCKNNQLTSLNLSNNTVLCGVVCSSNELSTLDLSNHLALDSLFCEDNLLSSLNIKNGNNSNLSRLRVTENPNLICIQADDINGPENSYNQLDDQSYFSENCMYGIEEPNEISGYVYSDVDCEVNGNEQGISGVIIKTEPFNVYSSTDSSGAYTTYRDTGTYQVKHLLSHPLIIPLCPVPNYHTVHFESLSQDTIGINFYNEAVACPLLTVDISSDRRRRCFANNTIVEYCNTGYADATNVEVIVQMPEYVELLSADFAYTSNDDGEFIFAIGDLAQGECGWIHIVDSVACISNITGLTQCTEAWITPPNDCLDTLDMEAYEAWDQSSISLEGACLGDSLVRFVISNTAEFAEGDMEAVQEYRILMDNALAETQTFQLNGGESLTVDYYANGQTIRLEADQHAMHPGFSHPEATIEICGNDDGTFSTGFVNNLPQDDADYDVEIECIEIIDSYDPNDKTVSPEGVSFEHYLEAGTILDYQIRFQNTGSDTAYTVVIVDTLSAHLDPATIEWGIASHPYTIAVTGMGTPVLSFTFNQINLPDSSTNELQSHGFIKYKVAAYETLENNTEIHNTAHIFFDFNEAIVTNTATVTISDTTFAHIPTQVETISNNDFEIYPNPTKGQVRIIAEDVESIEIYNLSGSLVKSSFKKDIDISAQAKGIYFVKVITSKGIHSKKLILI